MAEQIVVPGEQITPHIEIGGAVKLAEQLYGIKVDAAKELDGYDDKNYYLKVSERPNNEYIAGLWPYGYVFKIMNSSDSKKLDYLEAQCQLMLHLDKHGIITPQPQKTRDGKLYSVEKLKNRDENDRETIKKHVVRLLSFQEGTLLKDTAWSDKLHYEIGRYTAHIDLMLKDFTHPAYKQYSSLWMLKNVPHLRDYLYVIKDETNVSMVKEVIEQFESMVLQRIDSLQQGVIHGDFNDQNLLCKQDKTGEWHVCAVLDLGDSHYSAYLVELALTTVYMMLQSEKLETGHHVIAGYCSLNPLPDHELKLLKVSVCARLCQSLVLGLYTYSQYPSNTYVLRTQAPGWKLLETLWTTDNQQLEMMWFNKLLSDH